MFTERHKELFTLYSMSIGYAELFKCKISIIFVNKQTDILKMKIKSK